jgi:hypothetical protein
MLSIAIDDREGLKFLARLDGLPGVLKKIRLRAGDEVATAPEDASG